MEENNIENKEVRSENNIENISPKNNQAQIIAGAIIVAGILIAGAILLKGNSSPQMAVNPGAAGNNAAAAAQSPAAINNNDRVFGNPQAKVSIILYEDFQCPFCGKFFQESEETVRNSYGKDGTVQLVYRDFPFLGTESTRAAEAARCADDQGKFWEYHDYLFTHQNGENQGNFLDDKLKSFAKTLGLNTLIFNSCFDGNKYGEAVAASKAEASAAGVTGTPKGFILKNGKVVDTIDGAVPFAIVKQKIDSALK